MKKLAAISFLALLINAQIKPCIEDGSNAVGTSNIQRTYSRETTFFPSQGGSGSIVEQTSEQKTNERLGKIEQMIQAAQQKNNSTSSALTAGVAIGSVATAMVFVVANLTVLRRGA